MEIGIGETPRVDQSCRKLLRTGSSSTRGASRKTVCRTPGFQKTRSINGGERREWAASENEGTGRAFDGSRVCRESRGICLGGLQEVEQPIQPFIQPKLNEENGQFRGGFLAGTGGAAASGAIHGAAAQPGAGRKGGSID